MKASDFNIYAEFKNGHVLFFKTRLLILKKRFLNALFVSSKQTKQPTPYSELTYSNFKVN